jgi:hypothetical protein
MSDAPLGPAERRRLAHLADTLIPARDGMPAASQVDVHGRGVDRVTALLPALLEPLRRALAAQLPAERLRESDPTAFAALTTVVAGAYLTEPRVQRRLGYPGRPARRAPDPAELFELQRLVRPVIQRGSIWHATPAGESPEGA